MTTQPGPPAPPTVTDVSLTGEIKDLIDGAYESGNPILLAYVDADGQPSLSFRGSTHTHSEKEIGVWVRNQEGGLSKALSQNNRVTLFMRNPQTRAMVQIRGRARFDHSEATKKAVYEGSPEREQQADAERKGTAMIVDVERVEGMTAAGRFRMQRS